MSKYARFSFEKCKNTDKRYRDVFPEYQQYGDNPFATKEVYNWKLKDSNVPASHIAVSRDGQVTGKRANKAMIFDDMTKGAEEATDSSIHQSLYNKWTGNWINRRDGDSTKFVFAERKFISGNTIHIKENFTISSGNFVIMGKDKTLSIGKDCMFASGITIRNYDGHEIIDLTTGKTLNFATDINIGNNVWLGDNVTILKNTQIPNNCIIGCKSIVNKEITKSNCILAGTPARIIRENIKWER